MNAIRLLTLLLGPIVFILSLFIKDPGMEIQMFRVLTMALWMVIWWIGEAVPVPVTALLPLVLLPYLGVFNIAQSTAPYANPIIFLFMGGFMIALALEKHKLHLRIALNILKLTGTSGDGIILGFMISTALLSMWISNTATAVMMLPVALSVIELLRDNKNSGKDKKRERFALALMLCIAYAANIGGTMTLIGTPPNIVMAGYLKEILDYEIQFVQWLGIGLSVGITLLILTYFLLIKVLFPNKLEHIPNSEELIRKEIDDLGPISNAEWKVISIFSLTALAWIFKVQINSLFGADLLTDSATAMSGGLLMFIVPQSFKHARFLLSWEDMKKLPWGILLLFGGGMCLARSLEEVGLIQKVGQLVMEMQGLHIFIMVLLVTVLVLFLTEIMSNVALVTIFIPVAIGIAGGLSIDPLLLVVPATLASSCAFMMPISTPPNAVVFASGHIRMRDMMKTGWLLNIAASLVIAIMAYFLVDIFS
ncbi:MAG: DASS family sodium-coupled anion symporter [Cytophagales bacterium]